MSWTGDAFAAAAAARRRIEILTSAAPSPASVRFLDAWQHGGRGRSLSLGPAASVAMIHGLCGDHESRAAWLTVADQAGAEAENHHGYGAICDVIVLLHHGNVDAALNRVAPEPQQVWKRVCWVWLHGYVALRAETAVLAGHPEARDRIKEARTMVTGNPIATAQVDRAEALHDGDQSRLSAAATAFDAAGCTVTGEPLPSGPHAAARRRRTCFCRRGGAC